MSKQPSSDAQLASPLLRKCQIIPGLIPVSKSTFDRWVSTGKFPPGVLVSPQIRVWRQEEVVQWLLRLTRRRGKRK